jgi:hypothetical protein
MTIAERDKAKPTCPTCKGTRVTPQFRRVHGADEEEELIVSGVKADVRWDESDNI